MKSSFASQFALSKSLATAAATIAALVFAVPACSSDDPKDNQAACDSSQCFAGNTCLAYEGKTECRKTCSSNTEAANACPYGYTCVEAGQASPFCVKDTAGITKAAGQWGAPCAASGGSDGNPDCDSNQGFLCFGTSTTDAAAYCTRFDCTTDRDCGAGFYCGSANTTPNVDSDKRVVGETAKVCLRRSYGAPCQADFDCAVVDGVAQRCIADDTGAGFCTSTCTQDSNCTRDARCFDINGDGINVCYPRAGLIVGDGEICSPCRSDADCGDGACVQGSYTTEKSCTKRSAVDCTYDETAGWTYQCPDAPSNVPSKTVIACAGNQVIKNRLLFASVPKNYCHGLYTFGKGQNESQDVGCWSR